MFRMLILMLISTFVFAEDRSLNIITDRSDFHLKEIISNYERKTGTTVELTFIKEGILEKAKMGDYDIMISKNSSEIIAAKKEGLLLPLSEMIVDIVDTGYIDNIDNKWFLMSHRIRAFHVRNDVVDVPQTYKDLAKIKYKGRICIRKLTHSYNLELFGTMLYDMGDVEFTKWFRSFKENLARDPVGNDRNQVKGVYDGICDIAIANTYYRGLMKSNPEQKPWTDATKMYIPNQNQNDSGAISLFAGVGHLSHNPINKHFSLYLLSDNVQKGLSKNNFEYPVSPSNMSNTVKKYGESQGLNYNSIKLHENIQNDLFEYRKRAYIIVKNN